MKLTHLLLEITWQITKETSGIDGPDTLAVLGSMMVETQKAVSTHPQGERY